MGGSSSRMTANPREAGPARGPCQHRGREKLDPKRLATAPVASQPNARCAARVEASVYPSRGHEKLDPKRPATADARPECKPLGPRLPPPPFPSTVSTRTGEAQQAPCPRPH